MILSVLVPTLTDRKHIFAPFKAKIERMIAVYPNEIELIIHEDNYQKTTGQKRNDLIDEAKGKFSVFIDDDDDIPEHYFEAIISAIKANPKIDCIGFKGIIQWGNKKTVFRHSVSLPYSPDTVGGVYLRPPNHLNPMLTEYMRKIRFPDKTFAEDFDFCNRLAQAKLIKNEHFLNLIMYYYKFNPRKKPAMA